MANLEFSNNEGNILYNALMCYSETISETSNKLSFDEEIATCLNEKRKQACMLASKIAEMLE